MTAVISRKSSRSPFLSLIHPLFIYSPKVTPRGHHKYEKDRNQNENGETVLTQRVRNNDLDEVKRFMENTDIPLYTFFLHTGNDDGQTPLILSVILGYMDITRYLLKYDQNVNLKDKTGFTALAYAAYQEDNNQELIYSLVKAGAHVNMVHPIKDYEWIEWKAMDLAYSKLHTGNMKALLELGSDAIGDSCVIAVYKEGKTSISSSSLFY